MTPCPPPDQLESLLEGLLDDSDSVAVADHVGLCPACQERLEHLTDPTEVIAFVGTGPARPAAMPEFLDRLRRSAPALSGVIKPPPGELPRIDGYEILDEVGRGGMGVVYRARQLALKRVVALKMVLAGAQAGERDRARFRTEAEAVASLHHPNIVQIFEVGEANGRPFLALEFVEGASLGQLIRGAAQPIRASVTLVETVARAVQFAHQRGIVHRDLKPGNILLSSMQNAECGMQNEKAEEKASGHSAFRILHSAIPKITDFGLAKRLDGPAASIETGEVVGTPSYMAPEQARGRGLPVGPAADIYALGAMLHELLTGRPPFKGATALETVLLVLHEEPIRPSRMRPDLPADLENICLKCLEKDPARRYHSAGELADDLRRFRRGEAVQARPVGAAARAWKWGRRRPLVAGLLASSLLVCVVAFAGITWAWRSAARSRDRALVQSENARQALYHSRITRSQLHWRLNDLAGARRSLWRSLSDLGLDEGKPDLRGWEWGYLEGLYYGELLTYSHGGEGRRGGVAYHPSGCWLASVMEDSGELIACAPSGETAFRFAVPPGAARLAVRPDGSSLAVGGIDGTVWVHRTDTRELLWSARLHEGPAGQETPVAGLAYSPDGSLLATAGWDGAVRVVDARTGQSRHPPLRGGDGARAYAVAWSPNGDYLVAVDDRQITVWSHRAGAFTLEARDGDSHKSEVYGVVFSPDGRRLATAAANGSVRIWELDRGPRPKKAVRLTTVRGLSGLVGAVLSMDFSPDGRYLAYAGSDGTVRVWAVESGIERINFRCHARPVEGVRFSPDGRRLATCSPGTGEVKMWDLTSHPEYSTLTRLTPAPGNVPVWDLIRGPDRPAPARTGPDVEALCFTEDGNQLVSVTVGGTVQTWDARSGVPLAERKLPLATELVTPAVLCDFAPGGTRLAARGRDDRGLVQVWNVTSGQQERTLKGHRHPVFAVRFSPDGRRVASAACRRGQGGVRHELFVWDLGGGAPLYQAEGDGQVYNLAFSPDGGLLAAGGDGRVWAVDWRRGVKLLDARKHDGEVTAVAISPDGRELASAGRKDHSVRVWDLATGRERAELEAPEMVCWLAYSPIWPGRLAGISRDSVRLWDVQANHEVLALRGAPHRHWDPPFNPRLAFSSDGAGLAGTNWNESISIWQGQTPEDPTPEDPTASRTAARREAADARAGYWHLQEAQQGIAGGNLHAARFHLRQAGSLELSGSLRDGRAMIQKALDELAAKQAKKAPPR